MLRYKELWLEQKEEVTMGIHIGKKLIAYESTTMTAIDPEYLGITRVQLEAYLSKHRMRYDPAYSQEELIGDITNSTGFYSLPMSVKEETIEFIEDLLNELV